ncbi:unnamed protein product [Adineta steineri]|uniref:G-protein coupled receptors family 1 profile domain-containing protein n=1 Tax=Adineta steineri TaxID=433720 RepID=A0A814KV30_9BILA|nr:unnamed protein product [Adineta steineri]CAF3715397.1 unnamed protein product [Adineta steineri]
MGSLNLTISLPIDSVSSSDMEELEQGDCATTLTSFLLRTQPILLLIFGFAANLCSFVVLTRPRLRRRPTFSYLAFLSLSNALLSLIHASLSILGEYFGITVEDLPLFIFCRFLNRFAIDSLTHFSLYTLTAVDLDRIRTVTSKTANDQRYSRTNSGRQRGCASAFISVCLVESFLAIFSFLFNAHWLILYGYTEKDPTGLNDRTVCKIPFLNNTNNFNIYTEAYTKYIVSILPIAEIVLFNILPFLISILATIIILRHISIKYTLLSHINKRLKKSRRRMELHLSILLISLNCVFILLTTPHNIYQFYILKIQGILDSKKEQCRAATIQKYLDLLQQCYFMSTFFLYILTNKRFREEFYELLRRNLFLSCDNHETNNSSTQISSRHRRHHHRHHHRNDKNEDNKPNYLAPQSNAIMPTRFSMTDYISQDDCYDDEQLSTSKGLDTTVMRLSVNPSSLY